MRIQLLLVMLVALHYGCKSKKNIQNNTMTTSGPPSEQIFKATLGQLPDSTDAYTIEHSAIKGNLLSLTITFSGGCKDHSFKLIGSEMLAKSLPPQRSVKLIHNANGDHCREFITRHLTFDIRELAYKKEKGSEVYLNIDGAKERLLYTFE